LYKERRISVVIPAYNEEDFIPVVVKTIPAFVDAIIVIDDRSTDETFNAALGSADQRTKVLQPPENQGVGGATIFGYREAMSNGSDIVVKVDGDGQMDPECLPRLLDAIIDDGYDYAKGNRFLDPDALPEMPKLRLFGNIALTFLTKVATGYWQVFDPQNGYTAIRAEMLRKLNLNAVHRRFFFENDMLLQLSLHDARVKDVAIPARYGSEVSSLNPLQIIATFPLLLLQRCFRRVWHNYVVRDFSPIALFLAVGLLLLAWGTGFGLFTWVRSSVTGELASTGTVMLSVLPFFIGFQLLLQAIVLDIQHAPK
jgi:glycosyltransferase involved in cell wall biosynthesis